MAGTTSLHPEDSRTQLQTISKHLETALHELDAAHSASNAIAADGTALGDAVNSGEIAFNDARSGIVKVKDRVDEKVAAGHKQTNNFEDHQSSGAKAFTSLDVHF